MIYSFAYNSNTGRVKFFSEGEIKSSGLLKTIVLVCDEKMEEKMMSGHEIYIQGKQVVCVKPEIMVRAEEQKKKVEKIQSIKEKLSKGKVTQEDLKEAILELLN